jgi:lysyl endopeptidase
VRACFLPDYPPLRRAFPLVAVLLLILATAATAATDSLPRSRTHAVVPLGDIPVRRLEAVDRERLEDEDNAQAGPALPVRVAAPSRTHLGPARSGHVDVLPGGGTVWRQRVVADGATDLQFGFRHFELPPGATLHVYSENYDYAVGPWTSEDNAEHGQLWTPAVPGDRAVIELYVPAGQAAHAKLVLSYVGRGYRDGIGLQEALAKRATCNVDVTCAAGAAWSNEIRSVARYTFTNAQGTFLCTGNMMMDAVASFRSWFLTAGHCGVTASAAPSVVTYWNFQAPTCGSLTSGSLSQTVSGSTLRATRADVDFRLLELSSQPPANFKVFYAGWDRSGAVAASSVGIHHPAGGEKAISVNWNPVTSITSCIDPGFTQTHWLVDDWEQGITEPGSSGSGLFDTATKKLVGFLSGGSSGCNNLAGSDCYGKFSSAWDGAAAASRLRDWLDPNGTGVSKVDGADRLASEPPAAPSGLKATAASSSRINLSWNDNSSNETAFRVQRKVGTDGVYGLLTTTPSGSTAASDTGLYALTTYCYKVLATNSAGDSATSTQACATTNNGPNTTTTTTTTTLPAAVCGDANSDGKITAADALAALKAAVGSASPCTLARCDVDSSGAIRSGDALRILRKSVGEILDLACPA